MKQCMKNQLQIMGADIGTSLLAEGRLSRLVKRLREELHIVESIDMDTMASHGIASKNDKIKILGGGELSSKVSVTAHSFSASAVAAIEKAGGSVNKI